MKLYEFQGKDLFVKYKIPIPRGILLEAPIKKMPFSFPCVLKAQILSGNRKKNGGILFETTKAKACFSVQTLLNKVINGERVKRVLVEEKLPIAAEYYLSFSYDTNTRWPALAVSISGGSGIVKAHVCPINPLQNLYPFQVREIIKEAGFPSGDIPAVSEIILKLWELFQKEYALLAEINPLIRIKSGEYFAADAKVILDNEKLKTNEKNIIDMDGDIAILASGGGASLLNIDSLLRAGGKPANYVEYSGNPSAQVVADLTERVLSKKGLKGCWVVGGIANFTDIFETMRGFTEGLSRIKPTIRYPIVIRRDGPRRKEAFEMLKKVAKEKRYDFHIYGSEVSMAESAKIIVDLCQS